MNKIFIESKKEQTAECNFLKAILAKFFPDKAVQFVCMNGVGNCRWRPSDSYLGCRYEGERFRF